MQSNFEKFPNSCIKRVLINPTSLQRYIIIPKNSNIMPGDYVWVRKIDVEELEKKKEDRLK